MKKIVTCVHGGSERQSRGKNIRSKRHLLWTACPYRFVLKLEHDDERGWEILPQYGTYRHNHSIGPTTYRTYASERGVVDPINVASVQTMITAKAKREVIYNYLLQNGENVTRRDVDNIIARFRASQSSGDDNDTTAEAVALFAFEDPFDMATIDESTRGHTGVISITSATMRATYARFPELVLVDCTHKTNRYNYQLLTFMVIDEHGVGQPVQHSLIETNSDWHMICALHHFLRAHPTSAESLKVVMADKDLNEIRVVRGVFPFIDVLICTFHVIKYLNQVAKKGDYGRLAAPDLKDLDSLLRLCVHAKSLADYEEHLQDLHGFCEQVGFMDFFDYFCRNWDNCQEMWVEYFRYKLPYFRVNTNNHLESFFGKLKEGLPSSATMSECLEQLIAKERIRVNELRYQDNRIGTYVNVNFHHDELRTILRLTTHFVADNVANEFPEASLKSHAYKYAAEKHGGGVQVHGVKYKHRLDLTTWTCSCSFSINMKLPSRHAISYRIKSELTPLIPLDAVHPRWTHTVHNIPRVQQFVYHRIVAQPSPAPTPALTSEARYNEALRVLQPLCSEIAEISDSDDFETALNFVRNQWYNARLQVRT